MEGPTQSTQGEVIGTSPGRVGGRPFFDSGRPLKQGSTRQLRHLLAALAAAWLVATLAPEAAAMAETIGHGGATEADEAGRGESAPDSQRDPGQALRLPSRFRGVAGRMHRLACARHVAILANGQASRDLLLRQLFMTASSSSRINDPKTMNRRPPRGPPSV